MTFFFLVMLAGIMVKHVVLDLESSFRLAFTTSSSSVSLLKLMRSILETHSGKVSIKVLKYLNFNTTLVKKMCFTLLNQACTKRNKKLSR